MKRNNITSSPRLFSIIFCSLFFLIWNLPEAKSSPDSQVVVFTDYLPKYRTAAVNFMISKIDYTEEKMIFFYRYVAYKDNDVIRFHGAQRELAWRLTNSVRPEEHSTVETITKLADVSNIRLNDESYRGQLNDRSNTEVVANKGDIITCEIHFDLMPRSVRIVHLLGGDADDDGENFRFNLNDILIKSQTSNQLGNENQMEGSIRQFYKKIGYVKYPDITTATTLAQEESFDKKDQEIERDKNENVDPFEKHLAPIDYMPKMLIEMEDLQCNQRLILTDVHFRDNKPDFASRAKAMATINLVIEYLTRNPTAKIVLHGHTDIFGNAFKNLEISKQHVSTVKKVMVAKEIDPDRIVTIHHGGSQALPRYRNGGAMNRRVEIEVLCGG